MRRSEEGTIAAHGHDEHRAVGVEGRMPAAYPRDIDPKPSEGRTHFGECSFVFYVRAPHPAHGGIVPFQKARDALVVLFLDEESKRRSLDDHDDLGTQLSDLRETA